MSESAAAIIALREAGAAQFDPLRWHQLDALARRRAAYQGDVRRRLDDKLAVALASFQADFAQAQNSAKERPTVAERHRPASPLSALLRHIAQQAAPSGEPGGGALLGERAELKAVRHFRNTWATLSVSKQVEAAIDQAPENAGPLNSQFLMLRSLLRMRDLSPDYLNRFMSYADTLLCLEQADWRNSSATKKSHQNEGERKAKAVRGRRK